MLRTIRGNAAAALGLLLAVAACSNDDLFHPAGLTPIDPLFASYVSMGTTITAGWQSDGINDSTQVQSFAVLLARQMQTPFYEPLMNRPGCRPPIDNVLLIDGNPASPTFGKPHRVGNTFDDMVCALRKTQPIPPPYINNVAVPGASVVDATSNVGNPTALTTFFLGGLTQFEALERANPTFVTVEFGVTDVLGAATDTINAGDPAKITPVVFFTAVYDVLLGKLDGVGTIRGGILIGVPDVSGVPYFSYGYAYWVAYQNLQLPPMMTVDPNCNLQSAGGVGDTTLVPFHYGFELIAQASAGPVTLSCTDTHNIEPDELANIHATVAAYNSVISSRAAARGWPYVDPNAALAGLRLDPAQVAPFPNFAATSCTGVGAAGSPFGLAFTCDGVHLSAATNKLVANGLIQVINLAYGTSLQAIP